MASSKAKRKLSLTVGFPRYVGYADFLSHAAVSFRVENEGEAVSCRVTAEGEGSSTVPYEREFEAPRGVTEWEEELFSPLFLAENGAAVPLAFRARLFCGGREVASDGGTFVALSPEEWAPACGEEKLALFVRKSALSSEIVREVFGTKTEEWGKKTAGREGIERAFFALCAAVRARGFRRAACCDAPFSLKCDADTRVSPLALCVLLCSCLEEIGLYPVLATGRRAGAGVWLSGGRFCETVTRDLSVAEAYCAAPSPELVFLDAEGLFSEGPAVPRAREAFLPRLRGGEYAAFVDIGKCRAEHLFPMPDVGEAWAEGDADAPRIPCRRVRVPQSGEEVRRSWEAQLSDFSFRNPLLDCDPRRTLLLSCTDADELTGSLSKGRLRLYEGAAEGGKTRQAREQTALERREGLLRASSEEEFGKTLRLLERKDREAREETGCGVLCIACGFLRYRGRGETRLRRAPVVLIPAKLYRRGETYELAQDGAPALNETLADYLKAEWGADVSGDGTMQTVRGIWQTVRETFAQAEGRAVEEEVRLALFSFRGRQLRNDLHANFAKFSQNANVRALLTGVCAPSPAAAEDEDEVAPDAVLLPLQADSSQYAAAALAASGASFVLHGPPGTGKSQTIANIVANALYGGKRVLFVAEKRAALDVVLRRLASVGLEDFCLDLYSDRADREAVICKIEQTLSLSAQKTQSSLRGRAEELARLRAALAQTDAALERKGPLGVSVKEAILSYLDRASAPDVFEADAAFFSSLTAEKFALCREKAARAAAAAKACGGVRGSPFENVRISRYTAETQEEVVLACRALLAEAEHLRAALGLLASVCGTCRPLTERALRGLYAFVRECADGELARYASADEDALKEFYRCNRALDEALAYYDAHFSAPVSCGKAEELRRFSESGADWRLSDAARRAVRRLSRVKKGEFSQADIPKSLKTLSDIGALSARLGAGCFASRFTDRARRVDHARRREFLAPLYRLHAQAEELFDGYDPDAMTAFFRRAGGGTVMPVLESFARAAEGFLACRETFLRLTRADPARVRDEDAPDYFSSKARAILENIDRLHGWCGYCAAVEELAAQGLRFVGDALERGDVEPEHALAAFEKCVFRRYAEQTIAEDNALSRLALGTFGDLAERYRRARDDFSALARAEIRETLLSRLPAEEGALSRRLRNERNAGVRGLFAAHGEELLSVCPCLCMSPVSVAQDLPPEEMFDLVVFDEASQLSAAVAVGSLARARAAIAVGDPNQLPPTSFFRASCADDACTSVLDGLLAAGIPERRLLWHYRSKHESLIAFSNAMYYGNRLCTVPSPDAESRVRLVPVRGVYERGGAKHNRAEAEALISEIVRRLKDPELRKKSMGAVTFSGAQQDDVERLLHRRLSEEGLEEAAYGGAEPLFVKNLENVQGDERDVIFFSVCYGPDENGRLTLNFGPLNRAGGWRRLNVAVSRAREEMLVYSALRSSDIDLSRTASRGAAGLRAFLEYAERGVSALPARRDGRGEGLSKHIARELARYGYRCRTGAGASAFGVDVAVLDPRDGKRYLLGILCGDGRARSVGDRYILQPQLLKERGWTLLRVDPVGYFGNPKREISRVKETLDALTGHARADTFSRYRTPYRAVAATGAECAAFVTSGLHDAAVGARMREIVAREEPISRAFLKKRCLESLGIARAGARVDRRLDTIIEACDFPRDRVRGVDYFYKNARALGFTRFRTEGERPLRRAEEDFTVYEIVSLVRAALEERVCLYPDELPSLFCEAFGARGGERLRVFLERCVDYGVEKGVLARAPSDRITLA